MNKFLNLFSKKNKEDKFTVKDKSIIIEKSKYINNNNNQIQNKNSEVLMFDKKTSKDFLVNQNKEINFGNNNNDTNNVVEILSNNFKTIKNPGKYYNKYIDRIIMLNPTKPIAISKKNFDININNKSIDNLIEELNFIFTNTIKNVDNKQESINKELINSLNKFKKLTNQLNIKKINSSKKQCKDIEKNIIYNIDILEKEVNSLEKEIKLLENDFNILNSTK